MRFDGNRLIRFLSRGRYTPSPEGFSFARSDFEGHHAKRFTSKTAASCSGRHVYLNEYVKTFTYLESTHGAKVMSWEDWEALYDRPVVHRTVRRVHVMPWATPVRRIGRARAKRMGREIDGPAGVAGRRLF